MLSGPNVGPMLIDDTENLRQLLADLAGIDAYALDTEFHREGFYYPRLAVLQLASRDRVAVVDATEVDATLLRPLLEGPGVVVAHAVEQDLEVLDRACGAIPTGVFDTQIAAGFLGHPSSSLTYLVSEFLGRKLTKGARMTDWFRRPLTDDQITYAEADVAHLLELRDVIESRLIEAGRLAWATDECERRRTLRTPDIDTVWWRLKGSRQLFGAARGVAQEVAAWRERTAMALDRPIRGILPDETIVALADRPPRSMSGFPKSRLFDPRRLSPAMTDELMAAIARGTQLPSERLRLPPNEGLPSQLQPLAGLIAAWVSQQSRDLAIDAALLATRSDIEAFLRGNPRAGLNQGWRAELVGATVERIVAGRTAVAYDGRGSLMLIDREKSS